MVAEQLEKILSQGLRVHFKPNMGQISIGVTAERSGTLVEQTIPFDHITEEKISGVLVFCQNRIDELRKEALKRKVDGRG